MAKSEGKKQSTKKMEGKKKAPPLSKGKSAAESAVVRKRAAEKKKEKGVPTPTRSSSRIKGSSNPKTPATATPSKRKQDHRPEDSDSDFQNAVPVRRQKRTPREEAPISPDAPPIKAPSAVEKKDKIVQFRCKTGPIMDLNGKIVHHPRRNTIRRGLIDANFHGLLDIQVELINKELTQLLITSYEPDARRFVFPNGEVLTVQASDVGRVYGLVSTGERITVQSCPAVERRKLEASTGMRGNKYNIMHTNIKLAVLKTMIEECVDGNAFCRMYILHSLGTLLVPGNSWKITLNYAKYLNEDLSTLGTLNWGQYVVDTLLEGLDGLVTKASYPSGDFNFLVLHLLDMVRLDGLSAPKSPTCAFWDDGRVSEAVQMMKNSHGVWDFKLRRREQLKGLPLSEAPWLDELFETIPTQPTQDFATSSVRPVPTTFSGPTDGWAELVDVASADVGQLALMRQIAEAEVKYKRDELRGMEAHCRLWEARLTVFKDKAPSAGQGESSRQSRPLGETVVVPRPSPRTSEEMTSDSTSDSEDEVPNVGDIGKEAVAQAEKDIPENQPPRFVKAKSVQTPVFYDRPKTGSKTIGSPYVVEERVKKELTMDEHIIVKGERICVFPEKGNKLVRMEACTLAYNQWISTSVVDSIAYYLNREVIQGSGRLTRMCFPVSVGVAAREEVQGNVEFSLATSNVLKLMTDCTNEQFAPYLKDISWAKMEYPDTSSCGLYAARFMEHYVGRFRNEANWHTINVMKVDRLRYLCRLVKDRWNEVQHEVVVAANKYNDTLREEARLTKSLARSQARSQARKQTRAAKKNAK
ncbi:hypothetical protein LINPERHAP1_LOCUS3201 [Linum perenne]